MAGLFDTALLYSPLIPVFPLLAFAIIVFFSKVLRNRPSAAVAITGIGISLAISAVIFFGVLTGHEFAHGHAYTRSIELMQLGEFRLRAGVFVDNLTAMMLIVVTLVSFLVFVYSTSYMHGDPMYPRFFAYLSIFAAAMLILVLADSLLLIYIGWELVGLASYLLIGFWFHKPEAARAAVKAFLTTRIGDTGMLIGIAMLFGLTIKFNGMAGATFNFVEVFNTLHKHPEIYGGTFITFAAVFLFMGAVGKSAQFPLHIWLPDAMEGPTPVSALIHAATMVAAGVYLVARAYPIFDFAPSGMLFVALIGGFTAFFAATMGLVMYDIKKVLAYSTISQLGYMIMGLGVGGYTAGVFHLFTHAFFKALLFLGSGSVIHACHTQDMREMGGLRKKMPITYIAFLLASLSIAGIFPFAGFWSKDEILNDAQLWMLGHGDVLHALPLIFGCLAALMTAFYMFRLMFLTFSGEYRGHGHPHESPLAITGPLMVLIVPTVAAGWLGTPWANKFHHLVNFTSFKAAEHGIAHGGVIHVNYTIMAVSTVIAISGIVLAAMVYRWNIISRDRIRTVFAPLRQLLINKYYLDDLVDHGILPLGAVFIKCLSWFDKNIVDGVVNFSGWFGVLLSRMYGWFDKWIIDGAVNLIGYIVKWTGVVARFFQTGNLQNYALFLLIGVLLILLLK